MQQGYQIIPPPVILNDYVRYFWTLDICIPENTEASFSSYVDDSQGMSFQIDCNQSVLSHKNALMPVGMLHGLNTMPSVVYYKKSFSSFGLVFYPHVIKEIFGIDACQFTDKHISIGDHIERFLTEQIVTAKNTKERMDIVTAYLIKKINSTAKPKISVKLLVQHISCNTEIVTVGNLVSQWYINERQIERLFKEQVGVTPRHLIKVAKFQKALHLLSGNNIKSLTEIAYRLQYADQSHFIRHVRQLSGLSPKELQKQYKKSAVNIIV